MKIFFRVFASLFFYFASLEYYVVAADSFAQADKQLANYFQNTTKLTTANATFTWNPSTTIENEQKRFASALYTIIVSRDEVIATGVPSIKHFTKEVFQVFLETLALSTDPKILKEILYDNSEDGGVDLFLEDPHIDIFSVALADAIFIYSGARLLPEEYQIKSFNRIFELFTKKFSISVYKEFFTQEEIDPRQLINPQTKESLHHALVSKWAVQRNEKWMKQTFPDDIEIITRENDGLRTGDRPASSPRRKNKKTKAAHKENKFPQSKISAQPSNGAPVEHQSLSASKNKNAASPNKKQTNKKKKRRGRGSRVRKAVPLVNPEIPPLYDVKTETPKLLESLSPPLLAPTQTIVSDCASVKKEDETNDDEKQVTAPQVILVEQTKKKLTVEQKRLLEIVHGNFRVHHDLNDFLCAVTQEVSMQCGDAMTYHVQAQVNAMHQRALDYNEQIITKSVINNAMTGRAMQRLISESRETEQIKRFLINQYLFLRLFYQRSYHQHP